MQQIPDQVGNDGRERAKGRQKTTRPAGDLKNYSNDMRLAAFIAKRYLFAKKSHNVINIISAISAIGMAIGTAALIIILSVYNGFDSLIRSMMGNIEPDLVVVPATGKVFVPDDKAFDWIYDQPSVKNISCVLQEQVFINYNDQQTLAQVKGVDWIYEEESPIRNHILEGSFTLHKGDIPLAVVGSELAYKMGINPKFVSPIEIYFPNRNERISMSNPASSVEMVSVWPSGIFSINTEIDAKTIIVPIESMWELLEYENEVSAVEIRVTEGTDVSEIKRLQNGITERLGSGYKVKDRFQQNESLYKMMKYEKIAIYMILIFVIIIIASNIFGSLSMLIIEKKNDIKTLQSLGARDRLIKQIFVLEGWMISLSGLAIGLILGIGFSLLQQQFGFITMPGSFIVQAYPIVISWTDVLITAAGVAIIGYLIALMPVHIYSKRS